MPPRRVQPPWVPRGTSPGRRPPVRVALRHSMQAGSPARRAFRTTRSVALALALSTRLAMFKMELGSTSVLPRVLTTAAAAVAAPASTVAAPVSPPGHLCAAGTRSATRHPVLCTTGSSRELSWGRHRCCSRILNSYIIPRYFVAYGASTAPGGVAPMAPLKAACGLLHDGA